MSVFSKATRGEFTGDESMIWGGGGRSYVTDEDVFSRSKGTLSRVGEGAARDTTYI